MAKFVVVGVVLLTLQQPAIVLIFAKQFTDKEISSYRDQVTQMFYHAYNSYIDHAYPYDELRPLTCDGMDTWGSFSLTLIDALDTLAVMGNFTEFRRVAHLLVDKAEFDININVSVFETNIRVIGGLLSAHLLSHRAGMELEPGWPCEGPLLRLAESVARKLLPAFDTDTGMPYGTVNLKHGVPDGETPVTCTAGVTTFLVEFGTLSRLIGDPLFEDVALRSLRAMWDSRSSIGLVGNHIDVQTGKWTALDSGIGAGVDSYYEYLVKGAILLQQPELMEMFMEYRKAIDQYMEHDDWYMWVNMQKGQVTMPTFQSLEAYWPGLLSLVGDLDTALKALHNYHQVWKQYGFTPEFYSIPNSEANSNREGYPLRPELIESIMYLYRATKDPKLLEMGVDILQSIQHSARTNCGYATIKDVRDHKQEDRMESFFLAETTKYLYLLFSPDNFILGNGSSATVLSRPGYSNCLIDASGYVFNTEAHPIDISAVHCCSAEKKIQDETLRNFHDTMDLTILTGLSDSPFSKFLRPLGSARRHRRKSAPTVFPDQYRRKPSNSQEANDRKPCSGDGEPATDDDPTLRSDGNLPTAGLDEDQVDDIEFSSGVDGGKLDLDNRTWRRQVELETSISESASAEPFTPGFGSSIDPSVTDPGVSDTPSPTSVFDVQHTSTVITVANVGEEPVETRKLVSSMDRDGDDLYDGISVKTYGRDDSGFGLSTKGVEKTGDAKESEPGLIVAGLADDSKDKEDGKLPDGHSPSEDHLTEDEAGSSGNTLPITVDDEHRISESGNESISYEKAETESLNVKMGPAYGAPQYTSDDSGSNPTSNDSDGSEKMSGTTTVATVHLVEPKKPKYEFKHDHRVLSCPSQPFLLRMSVMGEIFHTSASKLDGEAAGYLNIPGVRNLWERFWARAVCNIIKDIVYRVGIKVTDVDMLRQRLCHGYTRMDGNRMVTYRGPHIKM